MSLRAELAERARKLVEHRASVERRHAAELAAIDRQLNGAAQLLAAWDTLTIDEALAAVETAGLQVRVVG